MKFIVDGQRLSINPRVTRDLLLTVRSLAKLQKWGVLYDNGRETLYINTRSSAPPAPAQDRPAIAVDPESMRLQGRAICIDPGHGGSDLGASGPTGSLEKDNNLAIALLLRDRLERNGAKVIMTRETDCDVAFADASASEELGARVDTANESKADIFVSIHNDSFTSPNAAGTTTFHYGAPESIRLAGCLQKNITGKLGTNDRGVRFASFYVIRYAEMPAVLAEIAFISNPDEEILLSSTDGRYNAAEAIFDGITDYFRV